MIPFDALMKFSIANWAEVNWVPIGLLQMVCTHHEALIVDAVTVTEHVAELVPAVGEVGVKTVLNGPTCWPADGNLYPVRFA